MSTINTTSESSKTLSFDSSKSIFVNLPRYFGVCIWHFLSFIISATLVSIAFTLPGAEEASIDVSGMLLYTLLEGAALSLIAMQVAQSGWRLMVIMFLVFHGTKVFMMLIEAAFFLNFWTSTPLISMEEIVGLELLGLIHALLLCPIVVLIFGKRRAKNITNHDRKIPNRSVAKLIKAFSLTAIAYMICYLVAGVFILIPLAGEAFEHTYGNFSAPWWMPLLQIGRGLMWAGILFPLVNYFKSSLQISCLGIGFIIATFSAAQLLQANPFMLDSLRIAHFIEVGVSMFVFAIIGTLLLKNKTLNKLNNTASIA